MAATRSSAFQSDLQAESDPPVAEVLEFSRARELADSSNSALSQNEETKSEQVELAGFGVLVRKLEIADGRPLHGQGRTECAEAHRTHPLGFVAAVDEALQANVARHCGLLVRLIRKDQFHVAAQALAEARASATREELPELRPGRFGRGLTTEQILERGKSRDAGGTA